MILDIVQSDDNKHKYIAFVLNKYEQISKVYFGAIGYSQYYDLLKTYQKYNNLDVEKREAYYLRHKKNYNKFSADWFSKKVLWPEIILDGNKKTIIDYLNNL